MSDIPSGYEPLLRRIADTAAELRYVKQHGSYRLAARLRRSRAWNALRWLKTRNRRMVTVRALGRGSAESRGDEVWLLAARPNAGEFAVPWEFCEFDAGWSLRPQENCPFGRCLIGNRGRVRLPVDVDPELRFQMHPWSGRIEVRFNGRRQVLDLYSAAGGELIVHPARAPMAAAAPRPIAPAASAAVDDGPAAAVRSPGVRSAVAAAFLKDAAQRRPRAVAVHCPRWLGVTSSTRVLFDCCYPVPETADREPYPYDDAQVAYHADVLCESGVDRLIFSGGDELHFRIMQAVKLRRPQVRCDMLWHGGFFFFSKDYDWRILTLWLDAARAGHVHTIGTVKKGMEEFLAAAGIRSKLVLNYIPGDPETAAPPQDGQRHVGMWFSGTIWKVPHAMIAALRMLPRIVLHAAGLGPRAREVAQHFGVPIGEFSDRTVPQAQLHDALRRTHLTLYVTYTECCPMMPLESIAAGVPCLIGPASHLFEDNRYLFDRLVVPFPDRADVIARFAARALDESDAIMAECRRYIPAYNAAAQRSVAEFLD